MITRYCDKAPDIPPPSLYYTFRGVSEIRDSLRADADARLRPDYGVETKRGAAADAPPACGDKSPPRSREAPPPLPTDAPPLPSDAAPAGATAFLCASEPLDEFGRSWTLVDNRAGTELHKTFKMHRGAAAGPRRGRSAGTGGGEQHPELLERDRRRADVVKSAARGNGRRRDVLRRGRRRGRGGRRPRRRRDRGHGRVAALCGEALDGGLLAPQALGADPQRRPRVVARRPPARGVRGPARDRSTRRGDAAVSSIALALTARRGDAAVSSADHIARALATPRVVADRPPRAGRRGARSRRCRDCRIVRGSPFVPHARSSPPGSRPGSRPGSQPTSPRPSLSRGLAGDLSPPAFGRARSRSSENPCSGRPPLSPRPRAGSGSIPLGIQHRLPCELIKPLLT